MRSLTLREQRLLLIISVVAFLVVNFLGYEWLAKKRLRAQASQRALKQEIVRLKELETYKPSADVNSLWLDQRLPAYKDVDQLETYLYNIVLSRATAANVELTKRDPRPTQRGDLVHRSIMDVELTVPMSDLVVFLHSLQDREAFRYISRLKMVPTKDEEQVRCEFSIEQWWRADSEEIMGAGPGAAPTLMDVPAIVPSRPTEDEQDGGQGVETSGGPAPAGSTATAATPSLPPPPR